MATSPFRKTFHPVLDPVDIEDIETHVNNLQRQRNEDDYNMNYKKDCRSLIVSVQCLIAHVNFLVGKCKSRVNNYYPAHRTYTNIRRRKETELKGRKPSHHRSARGEKDSDGGCGGFAERECRFREAACINHGNGKEGNLRSRQRTW